MVVGIFVVIVVWLIVMNFVCVRIVRKYVFWEIVK